MPSCSGGPALERRPPGRRARGAGRFPREGDVIAATPSEPTPEATPEPAPARAPAGKRRALGTWLRPTLALLLLAALVARVGVASLQAALARLSLLALLPPLAIVLADAGVRALSWQRLLHLHGLDARWRVVLAAHLSGTAIGVLVPSSLGTDAARTLLLARSGVAGTSSASSMLGLNLLNLMAVCLISSVAALQLGRPGGGSPLDALAGLVTAFCVVYAAGLALLLSRLSPLPAIRARLQREGRAGRIARWLGEVAGELHALQEHPGQLLALLGISVGNQLLSVATVWAVGRALGLDAPASAYLLVVPLFTIVRLLPMSVAGFGGDQVASVLLFGAVGVAAAEAAALSLVQAAVVDLYALLCGVFALVTGTLFLNREAR